MTPSEFLSRHGQWLHGGGPEHQIVVSTRVRLARNLQNKHFPGWAKKSERLEVLQILRPPILALPEMADAFHTLMEELSPLEKQMLVERHMISREHAAKGIGSAVAINAAQTLSIMINEEDHLRMQALLGGLQLDEVYAIVSSADTHLEQSLDFAFHEEWGYLTACPTNVGTGMRASAMLHLPALVMSDQMNKIINSVNKIGLVVRGLHGEGTEAMGNLFQVSNQTTLGESEQEILARLKKVITQILSHEKSARKNLAQSNPATLLDQVGRAYGILRHSHSISSKEALNLLSLLKLGLDLALFPETFRHHLDQLFIAIQPAHLQSANRAAKMNPGERDAMRSSLLRSSLASLPEPDPSGLDHALSQLTSHDE